jgi:hypothetical protein
MAAHEPEALGEGISREIIEVIKHHKDTGGLDEADAIIIELGRQIFGARKVTSATFARALRQFGRRTLVDLVALMGNYAGTAALLIAFDMQLDPSQPLIEPRICRVPGPGSEGPGAPGQSSRSPAIRAATQPISIKVCRPSAGGRRIRTLGPCG